MVQLPFSATASAVLVTAMIAGGAVGVATWSPVPAQAPAPQANTEPSVQPAAPAPEQPSSEAEPQPQSQPAADRTAATQPSPTSENPDPSQQQVTVSQQVSIEQTESTTTRIVAAPVIVTNFGPVWSCVGCVEHKNPSHPAAEANHPNHPVERHVAVAPRHEVAPPPHFFHPEHVAVAAAHSR